MKNLLLVIAVLVSFNTQAACTYVDSNGDQHPNDAKVTDNGDSFVIEIISTGFVIESPKLRRRTDVDFGNTRMWGIKDNIRNINYIKILSADRDAYSASRENYQVLAVCFHSKR
ncbi:hypothetical protein FEI17_09265 [Kosakonia radicincitans]|uniref:hypothetical protein n=1 Tax=Kosakonia radicincitans TaxID=283686 RepID=UPI0011EC23A3|nr:hypothetical protein [Kosakonia radicincitans]QEM90826.1 hypothetical protein FEI17_09265 [Kosakonia radicincitans]